MKINKACYNVVNLLVVVCTALLFLYEYHDVKEIFYGLDICHVGIITVAAFFVHLIKASRLYLAFYGSDINVCNYIKTYCKVTPVSVIFPFKMGEFFRMYCYGEQLCNSVKSIVTVILDRFMDTMALVTIVFGVRVFAGGELSAISCILMIFELFVALIFLVFPGIYRFWKKYILAAKASKNKLIVLKILNILNNVYEEVVNVTEGRGIILYFMSLMAWIAEIGSITLLKKSPMDENLGTSIANYLIAAMGGELSPELKQFIFISVVMMVILYVFIKIDEITSRKKDV